jgi:hypothetical protein
MTLMMADLILGRVLVLSCFLMDTSHHLLFRQPLYNEACFSGDGLAI